MNEIFTHFISRGNSEDYRKRLSYAAWFTSNFPESEFESDEFLFYNYLAFSVRLQASIKFDYFQIWIDTELRRLLHSSNVKITGCESLRYEDPLSFETAVRTTTEYLQDTFKSLEVMDSDVGDFPVIVVSFIQSRMEQRLTQALASAYDMLNATDNAVATSDELFANLAKIRQIYDVTKVDKLQEQGVNTFEHGDEMISDCGLKLIDIDSDGIFQTQLLGVEAQSGTGKTRFVIATYVYRALTIYHRNVIYYALEQRKKEIIAMLLAKHVHEMFGVQIIDKWILRDTVKPEDKHYVEAARIDLFESGKYGKFYCTDDDLFIDDLEQTLDTNDKVHGPFDLHVIDYMGMIKARKGKYSKYTSVTSILEDAYPNFKHYVRTHDKAGIAIGQFNKEGVAAGKADKTIETDHAQGGMVVYRNTDYNIAISMTDSMRAQNKRRFSQPKVRSSAGFPTFVADVRLGILYFAQSARKEA